MRRVNVMLDDGTISKASKIGEGNLSAGLRIAVKAHRRKKAPPPAETDDGAK